MAVVEHRLMQTRKLINHLLPRLNIDGTRAVYQYFRYAPRKNKIGDEKSEAEWLAKKSSIHGLPVMQERSWVELCDLYEGAIDLGEYALSIYESSQLPLSSIEPEEEFLRNYLIDTSDGDANILNFVISRSRNECAVFGDMCLKHWFVLIDGLSRELEFYPAGLQAIVCFVKKYGIPFRQNTRDLSKIQDEVYSSTVVLFFEMCLTESLLELNAVLRCQELNISEITYGKVSFKLYNLARELFYVCIPHPKKINNMLRAAYSWFVKTLGTAQDEVTVLNSRASDDRNSKDVKYLTFSTIKNKYAQMLRRSTFHQNSLKENYKKIEEAIEYANSLLQGSCVELTIMQTLFPHVYTLRFDPSRQDDVLFSSYLLSLQVMSGYGRAWVKNKGDNVDIIMKPSSDNYITRVKEKTKQFVQRAYEEAEKHHFTIVKPEEMYSSLLRLAKNTSSGMATTVNVEKSYSPKKEDKVRITSRQKALVIMREGQNIYSEEFLNRKFNTTEHFQTKGSRDVPIKSTRTIYAIHISVLAPQLLLTLPLNEYFSKFGGSTSPSSDNLGGKVIIGDLEATGSRVIDASDTFRNTADPTIITIALDYSDYDQHMSIYNFREGLLDGIRGALQKYSHLRYESYTIEEMLEFGYGDGRVKNTLWNGKRAVLKIPRKVYEDLPDHRKTIPETAAFKFHPPGVYPVDNFEGLTEAEDCDDCVLVSPWDGSDLARVTTHLSGENSTLVANSLHNMAIGTTIREEICRKMPGYLNVLSEMYVGDDMLWYATINDLSSVKFDKMSSIIFDTVQKSGHQASPSKTTILPFSAEKTQTHAKNGVYIPQDRMMMISSEKRKDIEDIQSYMRSNVMTYVTKCSRGFSEELAHRILLFKSCLLGYRKLKRTIYDGSSYRSRTFFSEEDGYTLCMIRDPTILYTPVEWNGYGASPVSLNIVMTPELYVDMTLMKETQSYIDPLSKLIDKHYPQWNETNADPKQIRTHDSMGLFSKLARSTVVACLSDPITSKAVKEIPLQGYGPHSLSMTMIHNALLKEPRARSLLSPGYELEYQNLLNKFHESATLDPTGHDLEITTKYAKIFDIYFSEELVLNNSMYPDVNLPPNFLLQKMILGNRSTNRLRMAYVDKIDSILRGDVVMRGFITANHIMRLLEDIGPGHSADDLTTLFSLMNIEPKVARRLAEYLSKDQTRFDMQRLSKGGIGGDEFTMSMNVLTQEFFDQVVTAPKELFQAEKDAVVMHASQILMTRAALGLPPKRLNFVVSEKHKREMQRVRIKSRLPKRRMIRTLCTDVRKLAANIIENQFV
uniref:RNA-directed RNA polymerase n=1 Tax=Kammavanpettai virus TaxID=2282480 RepID=A0A3G1RP36_9REOV|nr:RNA-dependent RNA polymerase [Kammavanpettai virus]